MNTVASNSAGKQNTAPDNTVSHLDKTDITDHVLSISHFVQIRII